MLSIIALAFGCGHAPTQRQETPPAGFKQVTIIDENGAHTVTMPAVNTVEPPVHPLPVQPVQPVLPTGPAPKQETVIGADGFR